MCILFLHFIVYLRPNAEAAHTTERKLDFLEGPFDLSYFRKVDNALILRRIERRLAKGEGRREREREREGESRNFAGFKRRGLKVTRLIR